METFTPVFSQHGVTGVGGGNHHMARENELRDSVLGIAVLPKGVDVTFELLRLYHNERHILYIHTAWKGYRLSLRKSKCKWARVDDSWLA